MKLFLLGIVTSIICAGGIYQLMEWWRKRLTFVTAYGQRVFDLGMKKKLGWTLAKEQIEAVEVAFLLVAPHYGFEPEQIKQMFKKNEIYYRPYPIIDPRTPDQKIDADSSGYVNAYYLNGKIFLGIQPKVSKTALVHELVHGLLREVYLDPDPNHKRAEMWEGGMCGEIDRFVLKHESKGV